MIASPMVTQTIASRRVGASTRCEIEDVLTEWAWLIDHGHADRAAALYAEDAIQDLAGVVTRGLPAIRVNLSRRAAMKERMSRHVISNVKLIEISASEVEAHWILTLFRSDEERRPATPLMVSDVRDLLTKGHDGWKIKARTIAPAFPSKADGWWRTRWLHRKRAR